MTPGNVDIMEISYFESGCPALRNDLLIVYVNLKDINGTSCFGENSRNVCLRVLNGGELRGLSVVKAEAGIASFVVSTSNEAILEIQAVSGRLESIKKIRLNSIYFIIAYLNEISKIVFVWGGCFICSHPFGMLFTNGKISDF